MNTLKVVDYIVKWLKDYAENSKMNGFVIGVSGGIDSAVSSMLCAKTCFGAQHRTDSRINTTAYTNNKTIHL